MAFVVDGADWSLDGRAQDEILQAVEGFLGLLDTASQERVTVWFGEDFSTRPVLGQEPIWALYDQSAEMHLPPEVCQELAAHLGRAKFYEDEEHWPTGFPDHLDVSIDGGPAIANSDVAWAHHNVRSRTAVACVGLWRRRVARTTTAAGVADLHWLSSQPDSTSVFWRDAIDVEGNSPQSFARFAPLAYPNLYFYENVLGDASVFGGGYHSSAEVLKRYLGALNDSGSWIFTGPPPAESQQESTDGDGSRPTNQLIQRRFALLKLDVAPENPNVYTDGKCRSAREVVLKGRTLYCEWHCKLEPHRNRVHIHAPVKESGEKVVVAIFTEHLPLP